MGTHGKTYLPSQLQNINIGETTVNLTWKMGTCENISSKSTTKHKNRGNYGNIKYIKLGTYGKHN